MKQEQLKVALCGYLPWGCMVGNLINKGFTYDLKYTNIEHVIFHNNTNKPILYNISTLTKTIIVKGYNGGLPFVPMVELGWEYAHGELGDVLFCEYGESPKVAVNVIDYMSDLDLLNRWKIDYRNLIGQGLAIDVETLNENCYE